MWKHVFAISISQENNKNPLEGLLLYPSYRPTVSAFLSAIVIALHGVITWLDTMAQHNRNGMCLWRVVSSPWLLVADRGTVPGPDPAVEGSWCRCVWAVPSRGPWPRRTGGSKERVRTEEWRESREQRSADGHAASRSDTTTAATQTSASCDMLYSTPVQIYNFTHS